MILRTLIFIVLLLLPCLSNSQVVHQMQFDRFSHYAPEDWVTYAPATHISSIDIGDDYVYFGTRAGGILRYHFYDRFWDYPITTSTGLRSNRIIKITFDEESRHLYVETPKGIDEYSPLLGYSQPAYVEALPARRQPLTGEKDLSEQAQTFQFPEFYRPGNQELPDFFTKRGFIFKAPNEIIDPFNRKYNILSERVVDKSGNLWLSTNGLGVGFSELNTWSLQTSQRSIPNILVHDVFLEKDGIWIGGSATKRKPSGIAFWNDSSDDWAFTESRYNYNINSDNVYAITGNGSFVFFATDMGIQRYDKKKNTWSTLNSYWQLSSINVNDLLIFEDNLFIATEYGMGWMPVGSDFIERPRDKTLNNTPVTKITAVDSTLLLATSYGVYEYSPESDNFSFVEMKSALPHYDISAVKSSGDSVWIAGSSGIALYNHKKDRWQSFTQLQSRLSAEFNDINFTPGYVWFASNKGLLRYNIRMDSWYLYTRKDGLASNLVYHIDVDGDELWLSTKSGLTIFLWQRPGRIE